MRRKRRDNKRKILIIFSVCFLFLMSAGYAAFQTNLNIGVKVNLKEQSHIIKSWTRTSQEDFHSSYYRENIVSISFLDNANVSENSTESWNVSEKENGDVMAWVVPNNKDNTKYDLYIGAKGGVIANEDSSFLFFSFQNVETIEFNDNFDTSNVINMWSMFCGCIEITFLDLSSFDTTNVTYMKGMFDAPSGEFMKLETIVFGENFKTNNVTNMQAMFGHCSNLKNLDLSSFDTSNVINMQDMFAFCYDLAEIDVSNFNTKKVTNMRGMFYLCKTLTSLDLDLFNTSNVTNMYAIFEGCENLTSLNLCSFNTKNVTNMRNMFKSTPKLEIVKVGLNWTTTNADTTDMFTGSKISSVTTGNC